MMDYKCVQYIKILPDISRLLAGQYKLAQSYKIERQ